MWDSWGRWDSWGNVGLLLLISQYLVLTGFSEHWTVGSSVATLDELVAGVTGGRGLLGMRWDGGISGMFAAQAPRPF